MILRHQEGCPGSVSGGFVVRCLSSMPFIVAYWDSLWAFLGRLKRGVGVEDCLFVLMTLSVRYDSDDDRPVISERYRIECGVPMRTLERARGRPVQDL